MKEIKNFLKNVTVTDTETTGKDSTECEVCEVATGFYKNKKWDTFSELFKPKEPIPAAASAKHLISNRMVENKKNFIEADIDYLNNLLFLDSTEYYIAHHAEFDRKVYLEHFKERGEYQEKFETKNNWICTWRLSKVIYGIDYERFQHDLQFLRFYLDLDVPDDTIAHRADADVLTTGKLLERLIQDGIEYEKIDPSEDIGEQLNHLCWKTTAEYKKWPYGKKYKGYALEDIPNDFYLWAMNNLSELDPNDNRFNMDLSESVRKILEERLGES